MKILHFADMHIRGSHLPEIKKCVDFMVDTAISEKPDLIINAGDTFHSAAVQLDSEAARYAMDVHKRLADIAPVSVILGTPGHDGKAAVAFGHINSKYPIHVTAEAPEQLFLVGDRFYTHEDILHSGVDVDVDAIISAFPAPTKRFFQTDATILDSEKQIAQGLTAIFASFGAVGRCFGCPHILSGHFNVSGAFISDTQQLTGVDIEVSKDQIAIGEFDLVCLGHIHKQQKMGKNLFFSGSTQNNTFGEMDTKGFYLHYLDSMPHSKFIPTPTRPMIDMSFDWTKNKIDHDAVFDTHECGNAKVRLTVKIFLDEVEKADFPRIETFFKDINADLTLNIIRMPRENVRSERIQDLDRLYDKITENAAVLNESVPEGIEIMADRLEVGDTANLVQEIREL